MSAGPPTAQQALQRARAWTTAQARAGWPGCAHEMAFPRWAGFSGPEQQRSDQFVRSVLAGLLLDIADSRACDAAWRTELQDIARHEADRLAAARSPTRSGGWSYFPMLAELPPDLDSLGAAIALFARIAPQHLALCDEPIAIALAGRRASGGLGTWLIGAHDAPTDQALMRRAIDRYWGDTDDVDVVARFHAALALADAPRHHAAIEAGAQWLRLQQQADGRWHSTWYANPLYTTELALPLLAPRPEAAPACERAIAGTLQRQHADGGWGVAEPNALDTAIALHVLARHGAERSAQAIDAGVAWLCERQTQRGTWKMAAWIQMAVGRADGPARYIASYGCETFSTTMALRALVLSGR